MKKRFVVEMDETLASMLKNSGQLKIIEAEVVDKELKRLEAMAQRYADENGVAYAVFNLNRVGSRMLVVRKADSFKDENRMVSGPYEPNDK